MIITYVVNRILYEYYNLRYISGHFDLTVAQRPPEVNFFDVSDVLKKKKMNKTSTK